MNERYIINDALLMLSEKHYAILEGIIKYAKPFTNSPKKVITFIELWSSLDTGTAIFQSHQAFNDHFTFLLNQRLIIHDKNTGVLQLSNKGKVVLRKYLKNKKYTYEREELERRQIRNVINTNQTTMFNIFATLLISFILLGIQIKTCNREKEKGILEAHQAHTDSLKQAQQSKHDSLIETYLQRLIEQKRIDTGK